MGRLKLALTSAALFLLPSLCLARPYFGANLSYALFSTEPSHLHGYQLMLNYDPQQFQWSKLNIYFDGGFSHFWLDNNKCQHSTINIYSIAPVLRYNFHPIRYGLPYLDLSVGIAYLNHTYIDKRNLGLHFSFQDRVGIGLLVGQSKQFSMGFHIVHYSNAHLGEHNSGMTIPLVLDVAYRFQ